LIALFSLALIGCGYTVTSARPDGEAQRIYVAPIKEPGLHVDTGAMVDEAVRRAVANRAGLLLVREPSSDVTLEVELLTSGAALEAFAEPGLRAGQYRASVQVKGRLVGADGRVRWESPVVSGEAPFLSPPGAIEQLDGAERRSLAAAADTAADRLIAAMCVHLRRPI
jgi:hypothetical protein